MSRIDLRAATGLETERLWPVVKAAHLYPDRAAFLAARDAAPWRVRIDSMDRAAVLERWRPHLEIMAIKGVWAPARDLQGVVEGLAAVARAQHLSQIMSPLISENVAGPYVRAGMAPHAPIVALRIEGRQAAAASATAPAGIRIRPAVAADLPGLVAADGACFEPFWAYDPERLANALNGERVVIAESENGVIGYTLCTVERGSGTLGRLGVVPQARGEGVGAALLAEALRHMARSGAGTISLCTQEENAASRSLYTRLGLRELPGRLLLLLGDA